MRAFIYAWSLPVTWQRWRSHVPFDPPSPRNPCCMKTSFYVLENRRYGRLLPIEVLHCGNKNFLPFLLLWPWPWHDDLHIRAWPVSSRDIPDVRKRTSYSKAVESYHITDKQTDRQTTEIYTTPLRRWSITSRSITNFTSLASLSCRSRLFPTIIWRANPSVNYKCCRC